MCAELFFGDKCLKWNEVTLNEPSKRSVCSIPLPTYHLEGILHRLRYLNCHRPKSYVSHQGGELYSKFHGDKASVSCSRFFTQFL